jgi:ABC-type Zn uptake system ZnuABC Zn-binding protein ZnuA
MTPAQFKQIVDYIKSSGIKVVTVKEGRALMPN